MDNWKHLIEAGQELARAFDLLDRLDQVSCISQAQILTGEALLLAAREAVVRANSLMGRA